MTAIRVLIVDDHPLFREGVLHSLSEDDRFLVVGEASTAEEAGAQVVLRTPDVVLLDLSIPGGGLMALRNIVAAPNAPRVAILTVSENDDDVMQALKGGAAGYILKGVGSDGLCRIVADLAEGRSYVAPSLAMKVLATMNAPRRDGRPSTPLDTLSKREADILRLVALGMSNKEVGRKLDIQEKTVKHYMTIILENFRSGTARRQHL